MKPFSKPGLRLPFPHAPESFTALRASLAGMAYDKRYVLVDRYIGHAVVNGRVVSRASGEAEATITVARKRK